MSIRAGSILHLSGNNVIDRIQSAGLGNVNLPIETVREVGNREVVDKIAQEPDFTFTMDSWDVSTDVMAFLTGAAPGETASAKAPGASDPEGTEYDWLDCQFVNIPSPWKDPTSASAGKIEAGHLIPGFYPTKVSYSFGVTDNASQTVELGGGSFYYYEGTPVEDQFAGNGIKTEFASKELAVHTRRGGAEGSTFRAIFGVIVDGELQTEEVDYTVTGGAAKPGSTATVTFLTAPANGADVRFAYFTSAAHAFPQTVHASTVVKPGAVRGRNVQVVIDGQRVGGMQSATLEATVEGEVERELGTEDIVGRVNNGTDANGTLTFRAKDKDAFFALLEKITGVSREEVFGWFNDNKVRFEIRIENPKNPGAIIKTLLMRDAKFQPPGTPAQVNSATDFAIQYSSVSGSFQEVKGLPNDAPE
jgi:hypothetical protein